MKIRLLFLLGACCVLAACGDQEKINEKPELAPICPEGRYWLDASKSCVLLDDELLE